MNASEQTTKNGQISLKANEVAVILGNATGIKDGKEITGFPARTSFAIREILSDQEQEIYKIPTYDIDENTVQEEYNESVSQYSDTATGEIKLGANAYVEITNALQSQHGDLIIRKKLPKYNETLKGATFVYAVTGVLDGKTIYDDVVAITFDKPGTEMYVVEELFPVGTIVTVEEVYSGAGYKIKNPDLVLQSEKIEKNKTKIFSFENSYVDGCINSGSSVVNTFKKEEGWSYTATPKDQVNIPSASTTGGGTTPLGGDDEKKSDTEA